MELRHLRYFIAVAHRKHFTQAAKELNLAQPARAQQIQQLERELGIALLERTSRRVRLTTAGEAFLSRAEHILSEVEQAQREMQEFAGLKNKSIPRLNAPGGMLLGDRSGYDWQSGIIYASQFHRFFPETRRD